MLARHLWMQKIWGDEYADYEKYEEAFKKAVVETITPSPRLNMKTALFVKRSPIGT